MKEWRCVLVASARGRPDVEAAVAGPTFEALLRRCEAASRRWPARRCAATAVRCVCLACDGGGGVVREVKGAPTRVKCPACRGTKTFETRKDILI